MFKRIMLKILKILFTKLPLEVYPKIVSLIFLLALIPVGTYLMVHNSTYLIRADGALIGPFVGDYGPIALIVGSFVGSASVFLSILNRTFRR
jgi:hypothetical protein